MRVRAGGRPEPPRHLPEAAISINSRTYRFACSENEVQRLEDITKYLKAKLDGLMQEHGAVGDERLILMAALMVADELFDARADIDELLDGRTEDLKSLASPGGSVGDSERLKARG